MDKIFKDLYEKLEVYFIDGKMDIDAIQVINDFWGKNADMYATVLTILVCNEKEFRGFKAPTRDELLGLMLIEIIQFLAKIAVEKMMDDKGESRRLMEQARIRTQILFFILFKNYVEN